MLPNFRRFRSLQLCSPLALAIAGFAGAATTNTNPSVSPDVKSMPASAPMLETVETLFLRGAALEEGNGGAPKDEAKAARCYLAAAQRNYAPAQFNLALLYEEGRGVEQNSEIAAKWYLAAAEQGDSDAQNNLATLYTHGNGVPLDLKQAAFWYTKAVALGNVEAMNNLANAYREGRGVERDPKTALLLFQQAAFRGYAPAQSNLGLAYANGSGAQRDFCTSYAWLSIAAQKLPVARSLLEKLSREMSPEEIAEAKQIQADLQQSLSHDSKEIAHQ